MTAPVRPARPTRETFRLAECGAIAPGFELPEMDDMKDLGRGFYKTYAPHASMYIIGRVFVLDKETLKFKETSKIPQQNLLAAEQPLLDLTYCMSGSAKYPTVVKNRVSFITKTGTCLAYFQDSLWHALAHSHNRNSEVLYCQDMYKRRSAFAWFCATSGGRKKDDKIFTKLVNLYMRIPWLLLNPGENGTRFARIKTPADKIKYDDKGAVKVLMPGCVLYSPALFWLTCAMFRETLDLTSAVSNVAAGNDNMYSKYGGDKVYNNHNSRNKAETAEKLMNTVSDKDLIETINSHDYEAALEIWDNMRPHMAAIAMESGSDGSAWFHPSKWNGTHISGLWAFENLVHQGGWASIGPSLNENWKLGSEAFDNIITHGGTALPWERFLLNTTREPCGSGVRNLAPRKLPIATTRPPNLKTHMDEIHLNNKKVTGNLTWIPKDV